MSTSSIPNQTLIFAYGTLKRNFPNHNLLEDLIATKDATFMGPHKTTNPFPLIIGLHGIPYLLNHPGSGLVVSGELYAVSEKGLMRLDELEGIEIGHYERLPVEVRSEDGLRVEAEGYFGHNSFGEDMWRKKGGMVIGEYTLETAERYARKAERRGSSGCILDDIRMFLKCSDE